MQAHRIFCHAPFAIHHIGQKDVLKDLVKLTEGDFDQLEEQVTMDIDAPILCGTLGTQVDAPNSMVPPMFDTPDYQMTWALALFSPGHSVPSLIPSLAPDSPDPQAQYGESGDLSDLVPNSDVSDEDDSLFLSH
jgi:hypothetical protein